MNGCSGHHIHIAEFEEGDMCLVSDSFFHESGEFVDFGFRVGIFAYSGVGKERRIEVCRIAGFNYIKLDLGVLLHQILNAVDNIEAD